jgi:hypothetical protein
LFPFVHQPADKISNNLAAYRGLLKRNFQFAASTAFPAPLSRVGKPMVRRSNQGQVPVTSTVSVRLLFWLSSTVTVPGVGRASDGLTRVTRTTSPVTLAVTALVLLTAR